jgi:hypothetical protein
VRPLGCFVLLLLLTAGCTTSDEEPTPASPAPAPSPSPAASSSTSSPTFAADIPTAAERVLGACGSSTAYEGEVPAWLDEAMGSNVPLTPYVVADPPIAAGFITHRLRAGVPSHAGNKILWAVRTPRADEDLVVRITPLGADRPVIREVRSPDSGPGEIYPDGFDVPTPGCWHVELRWATGVATMDLRYFPSAR